MKTPDDLGHDAAPVVLDLPFRGSWLARNSPARRVPSHGTHLFGTPYAIDFVAVDERGRTGAADVAHAVRHRAAGAFLGFGRAVLAARGGVVTAHDGEADHVARRSQLAWCRMRWARRGRVRRGPPAVAGNHVVIALGPSGPSCACPPAAGLAAGRPRRGG